MDLWIMLDLEPEMHEIWRPVAHFTPRPDEIARRKDLGQQVALTYRPAEGRTESEAIAERKRLNAAIVAVGRPVYERKRALRQEASARAAELDRKLGARAFAALREIQGVDPSALTDDYPVSHGLLEVRATARAIVAMAELPLIARIEAAAPTGTPGHQSSSQPVQVDPSARSNANSGEGAALDTGAGHGAGRVASLAAAHTAGRSTDIPAEPPNDIWRSGTSRRAVAWDAGRVGWRRRLGRSRSSAAVATRNPGAPTRGRVGHRL